MRTMVHSPLNLKKNEQKVNKKMLKDTATVSRFSQEVSHKQGNFGIFIIKINFLCFPYRFCKVKT